MFYRLIGALVGLALFGMTGTANAAIIVDNSALPINADTSNFGSNGGVQLLNTTTFQLESVSILLGSDTATTLDFQVIEFDGALGDATGTEIGTVSNVTVGALPFSDFGSDSVTIDVSSLNLTLMASVVYGFAFDGGSVRGGSTDLTETDPNIGAIFAGDGNGGFLTDARFEIPFIATGSLVAVPEPGTLALLGFGLAGLGFARRRRSP